MKATINSLVLYKNLQNIKSILRYAPAAEICNNVLVSVQQNKFVVGLTNLQNYAEIELECESEHEFMFLFDFKILRKFLKNIPEQPITFELVNEETVFVSFQKKWKN